tara:strand:- start:8433 stop:9035 length:603 start_codon:yes stop_codon:yes gene_type:complete
MANDYDEYKNNKESLESRLFNMKHGYPLDMEIDKIPGYPKYDERFLDLMGWGVGANQLATDRYRQDYGEGSATTQSLLKDYWDSESDDYYDIKDKKAVDRAKKANVGDMMYATLAKDLDDYLYKAREEGYQAQDNIMQIIYTISDANLRKKEIDERLKKESQARKDFAKRVLGTENPADALKIKERDIIEFLHNVPNRKK